MLRYASPFKVPALLALALCAPARAQTPRVENVCPEIVADGPPEVGLRSESIAFRVVNIPPGAAPTYKWTLSAGLIVSGQGTELIATDLTGVRTIGTEAAVEIGGLPGHCRNPAPYTLAPVIACGRPLDAYGNIRFEDERARLDNFAIELQNDPTARGHIICYGGRVGRKGEARRRCQRAVDYMSRYRNIEASRVVTVDGGFREDLTVEFWVMPPGVTPPPASPTVDPGEVRFVKGREKGRARRR